MALSPLREQLIGKVKEGPGRDAYRAMMEDIPESVHGMPGQLGEHFYIRLIKGARRLQLSKALLTEEGLKTADGNISDCGAALVRMESGTHGAVHYDAKRYAGKEAGDVHRIQTAYYEREGVFGLSTDAVKERFFDVSYLQPTEGRIIQAKMGDSILQGVLVGEENLLTEHIRACLAPYEKDIGKIRVLLRHPSFLRVSDTVDGVRKDIRTLYTDGSQLHPWNAATEELENSQLSSTLAQDSNRPGMILKGLPAMMEDVMGSILITTADGGVVRVCTTDLMPRCKDAQQSHLTGELIKQGNEAKAWRIANRPRVEIGEKKSLVHTAGACAHVDPGTLGNKKAKLILGGAGFIVESEKTRLRR